MNTASHIIKLTSCQYCNHEWSTGNNDTMPMLADLFNSWALHCLISWWLNSYQRGLFQVLQRIGGFSRSLEVFIGTKNICNSRLSTLLQHMIDIGAIQTREDVSSWFAVNHQQYFGHLPHWTQHNNFNIYIQRWICLLIRYNKGI